MFDRKSEKDSEILFCEMHSTLYSYSITCFIIPTEWTEVDNQRRTIQNKSKQKNKQWYTKHYIERKRSNNTWRLGVNSGASGLQAVPAPLVAPFVLLLLQIANECCVLSSHLFLIWFVCFCWSDRSSYPIFVEVTDRAIQSLLKWQIVLSNLSLCYLFINVDILPTRGKHLHDPIISLRTETWYHWV